MCSLKIVSAFFLTCATFCLILLSAMAPSQGDEIYNVYASVEEPQILLINAYHRGYGWTDAQTNAIVDTLETHGSRPIYYVEYLDWKRQPNQENLDYQLALIQHKYRNIDIDLIIATDDIGMQFAIDNRETLAPEVPIVFTGVFEESAKTRMEGVSNITGVYESIDPFGMMEMILELHPRLEYIYIINDSSETGQDVEKEILTAVKYHERAYDYDYEFMDHLTYTEIKERLLTPVPNSVVVIGTHNIDAAGDAIPNEIFCQSLADIIDIPMYSTYEYLFGHGIVGGSLLAGSLQGQKGVEIALEVLEGADAESIDEFTVKTVYQGVDYTYAERFELPIERLNGEVTVINQPVSLFEMYREVILTALAVILVLMILVVVLLFNIRSRKRTQFELELKHEELYETYENLASSEQELQRQNEMLVDRQEKINYLAFYDKLTGLPNRNAVDRKIHELVDRGSKDSTLVAIVDLDNFNYINSAYGHQFGDALLKYVGEKFMEMHQLGYFTGRFAGDEFFVMKQLDREEDEGICLQKIDDIFNRSLMIMGKEINVTKSIGYTIFPQDGKSFDELISRTDVAKKKMKQQGKSMTSRFLSSMGKEMSDRTILTRALKSAVNNDEMYVVYQPQYDIFANKIVGFESLVRWESPMVGKVKPAVFIPLAEEAGEILHIGSFVLEESIKFLKKYQEVFSPGFRLSVNISVLQLLRQDFIDQVKTLLNRYDVPPNYLEFEITESVLIESFDMVNQRLLYLKLLGITIALDDFGTGYSSLTYLEKMPISTLKIDKTFIDGIVLEGEEHFFTKSIIDIAHKLGFRVVSEGVEEEVQVDYLKKHNSRIIQGYWYSKPLLPEDAIALYESTES